MSDERECTCGPRVNVPCQHPGCLHHVTHPCEKCGRTAGHYPSCPQNPLHGDAANASAPLSWTEEQEQSSGEPTYQDLRDELVRTCDGQAARIRELEAAVERLKKKLSSAIRFHINGYKDRTKAEAERDALRAKVKRAREAIKDVLLETASASAYSDGPCLNKETRHDLIAALKEIEP